MCSSGLLETSSIKTKGEAPQVCLFSFQAYYLVAPLSLLQPSPHSLPRFLPLLGSDGHLLTALPTRITLRAGLQAAGALGLEGAGRRLAGLSPRGAGGPWGPRRLQPRADPPPSGLRIGREASGAPRDSAEGVSARHEREAGGRARSSPAARGAGNLKGAPSPPPAAGSAPGSRAP